MYPQTLLMIADAGGTWREKAAEGGWSHTLLLDNFWGQFKTPRLDEWLLWANLCFLSQLFISKLFLILFIYFFTLQLKTDLSVFDRSSELLPELEGAWWWNDPSMTAGGLNTKNIIALTTAALPTSSSFMSLLGFLIEFRTHTEPAETSHSCSEICLHLGSPSPSQRTSLKDYLSDISWLAFPGAILLYKEMQWTESLVSLKLASHDFKSDWWFWVPLTAAGHFKML